MSDILDDKPKKVLETVIKIRPDKAEPDEYQSKCEILMDLCLNHFDRHRVMLMEDYDNLMTQAQEKHDGK